MRPRVEAQLVGERRRRATLGFAREAWGAEPAQAVAPGSAAKALSREDACSDEAAEAEDAASTAGASAAVAFAAAAPTQPSMTASTAASMIGARATKTVVPRRVLAAGRAPARRDKREGEGASSAEAAPTDESSTPVAVRSASRTRGEGAGAPTGAPAAAERSLRSTAAERTAAEPKCRGSTRSAHART